MSRPLRIEYQGAWYHVMNRGAGRKAVFKTDEQRQYFFSLFDDVTQRFGADIHAYCLMCNHYHLLIHTPEGNLQRIMRHVNGIYTQYVNRQQGTDGPLFRGRYKAVLVDKESYWLALSRYIHRHPLEARMVTQLEKYKWSSYPAYVGKTKAPDWLRTDDMLKAMGGNRARFRVRYRNYVEQSGRDEISAFYQQQRHASILGDDHFKADVLKKTRPLKDNQEITVIESVNDSPNVKKIVRIVAHTFEVPMQSIWYGKRGCNRNLPRLAAMYLSQQICRCSLNEIAKLFHLNHYASVASSIRNLKTLMEENRSVKKSVKALMQDLVL